MKKIIQLLLLLLVSGAAFGSPLSRDTFPSYDSLELSQAALGQRDIRFNTSRHFFGGVSQRLKTIRVGTLYKAVAGLIPRPTFRNGITDSGTNIELGGSNPLIQPTIIRGNNNLFAIDSASLIRLNTFGGTGTAVGGLILSRNISLPSFIYHYTPDLKTTSQIRADVDGFTGGVCYDSITGASGTAVIKYGGTSGYTYVSGTEQNGVVQSHFSHSKDGFFADGIDTLNAAQDTISATLRWNPVTKEIVVDTPKYSIPLTKIATTTCNSTIGTPCFLLNKQNSSVISISPPLGKSYVLKMRLRVTSAASYNFGIRATNASSSINFLYGTAATMSTQSLTATPASTIISFPASTTLAGNYIELSGIVTSVAAGGNIQFVIAKSAAGSPAINILGGDYTIEEF